MNVFGIEMRLVVAVPDDMTREEMHHIVTETMADALENTTYDAEVDVHQIGAFTAQRHICGDSVCMLPQDHD